jgi:hypothetical protein
VINVVNIADSADVHFLVEIIFDLHDLVAGSNGLAKTLHVAVAGGV